MISQLLVLLVPVSALFFSLEPLRERCVGLLLQANEGFTCAYVVSGEGEYNVVARVVTPGGEIMFQSQHLTREGKFAERSGEAGRYRLCFRAFDRRQKRVSFDFSREVPMSSDSSSLSDELMSLKEHTRTMHSLLAQVSRNIKFTVEQERAHRDLAEQTCERVLWSAVVKVLALAGVAIAQMRILGGALGGKEKVQI